MTTTTERGTAPGPRAARARAATAAPQKIKLPREQDPRNPNLRLQALLDAGSIELIEVRLAHTVHRALEPGPYLGTSGNPVEAHAVTRDSPCFPYTGNSRRCVGRLLSTSWAVRPER